MVRVNGWNTYYLCLKGSYHIICTRSGTRARILASFEVAFTELHNKDHIHAKKMGHQNLSSNHFIFFSKILI